MGEETESLASNENDSIEIQSQELRQIQEENQKAKEEINRIKEGAYQNSTIYRILDRLGTGKKRTEIRKASWRATYQDSTIIIGTIFAFIAAGLSLGRSLTTENQTEVQYGLIISELITLIVSLLLQVKPNSSDFNAIENLHATAKKYLAEHKDELNQDDIKRAENAYKQLTKKGTLNNVKGLADGLRFSPWVGLGVGIVSGAISATTYFFEKQKTVSLVAGTFGPIISSTINTFVSKRLSEEALVLQEILKDKDGQLVEVKGTDTSGQLVEVQVHQPPRRQ